jgi:hypothetical protein
LQIIPEIQQTDILSLLSYPFSNEFAFLPFFPEKVLYLMPVKNLFFPVNDATC